MDVRWAVSARTSMAVIVKRYSILAPERSELDLLRHTQTHLETARTPSTLHLPQNTILPPASVMRFCSFGSHGL
eukprot:52944-Eustigmatos_ZCMA.PRE.1